MISASDIYIAVTNMISDVYPTIEQMGKEIKKGISRPSFFVEILPRTISEDSVNYRTSSYHIYITYFQEEDNTADDLEKFSGLQNMFSFGFYIDDVYATVDDIEMDYIGQDSDIMQVTVNISLFEFRQKDTRREQLMQELLLKNE